MMTAGSVHRQAPLPERFSQWNAAVMATVGRVPALERNPTAASYLAVAGLVLVGAVAGLDIRRRVRRGASDLEVGLMAARHG